jgi:2,3-bisphosphoglycerate-independent phosphoglycerate mutase
MQGKLVLIILDGWGKGTIASADAITHARVPFFQSLLRQYPNATLTTHGEAVGLPDGQMGNSEVGHLNIGSGRVVYQDLPRINRLIDSGALEKNATLQQAFLHAKEHSKPVHFIGLVSDGGVHSHFNHLKALVHYARQAGVDEVFVHAFTDGRDCDPQSGAGFIRDLEAYLTTCNAQLVSVIGRYYAMDRDQRWARIKEAYALLVHGAGEAVSDFAAAMEASYAQGITDEFMNAKHRSLAGKAFGRIKADDVVICFNYRTDRCRQITRALTLEDFHEFGMRGMPLHFVTLTRYDDSFKTVHVMVESEDLKMTLGETLALAGKKQLRIAETEKYPHVSFFFSGQHELPTTCNQK